MYLICPGRARGRSRGGSISSHAQHDNNVKEFANGYGAQGQDYNIKKK